ncbi:hypothetical protein [Providencia sp. 2024EL-00606]|uniref:hypothetical protein n=1 Tax=Providencia sp. 2024EL-00606 TaxID=3350765 RepID=UPI003607AD1A
MANGHAYVVQKDNPNNSSGFEYHVWVDGKVVKKTVTQEEAADWAVKKEYPVHVARVRFTGLPDFDNPNHWRKYP